MAKCPICENEGTPIATEQVSTAGWVIFIVLLLLCFPLCWIPFVVGGCKETVYRCPQCQAKLGIA